MLGKVILQPVKELLRYLKGDGAIGIAHGFFSSFKVFVEYIRDVVCQRLSTLLLLRSQPLMQRQWNGCAEVFLFLHDVLLSASREASKA